MKEKETCRSHIKKKKKKDKENQKEGKRTLQRRIVFFFFFFFPFFSDLRKSDRRNSSGQERKVLYATRATREYQKHGISPRIQVKIRKILIFGFSQIYGVLTVRIFLTKS